MKNFKWLGLAALVLSGTVQAASFDCAKAQSKVEKMVCADAELSRLDDEIAAAYKTALHDRANSEGTRHAQKEWLKERDGCGDGGCVKAAYLSRLTLIADKSSVDEAWKHEGPANGAAKGKGYTVCDKVKQRLNQFKYPKDFSACAWRAIATTPGLIEPPWQDINPKEHEALLYKLFKYRMYPDPSDYFSGKPPRNGIDLEERIQRNMREFFDSKGRMRVWRTRLPLHEGTAGALVDQDVTLIQLAYKNNKLEDEAACLGFPFLEWIGNAQFAVTDDLKEPDPRLNGFEKNFIDQFSYLYNGKHHFISSHADVEISSVINGRYNHFCTIEYLKKGE